jgi:hypothetical protein
MLFYESIRPNLFSLQLSYIQPEQNLYGKYIYGLVRINQALLRSDTTQHRNCPNNAR